MYFRIERTGTETTCVVDGGPAMRTGHPGLPTASPHVSLPSAWLGWTVPTRLLPPRDGTGELLTQSRPFPGGSGTAVQTAGGQVDASTFQSDRQASEARHERSGFQGYLGPSVTLAVGSHANGSRASVQMTHWKLAPVH